MSSKQKKIGDDNDDIENDRKNHDRNDDRNERKSRFINRSNEGRCAQFFAFSFVVLVMFGSFGTSAAIITVTFYSDDLITAYVPLFSLYVLLALLLASLVLSILSVNALERHARKMILGTTPLLFLIAILQLLYIIVLGSLKFQPNMFQDADNSISGSTSYIEHQVMQYIVENEARWLEIQDRLECCGYDFRAYYLLRQGALDLETDLEKDPFEILMVGSRCFRTDEETELETIFQQSPGNIYTTAVEQYYRDIAVLTKDKVRTRSNNDDDDDDDDDDNDDDEPLHFFCKTPIIREVSSIFRSMMIGIGVLVFFELSYCSTAYYLICFAPVFGRGSYAISKRSDFNRGRGNTTGGGYDDDDDDDYSEDVYAEDDY